MLQQPDDILGGKAITAYYSPSCKSGGLRRKCCAKRLLRHSAPVLSFRCQDELGMQHEWSS